jgi:hypothetical protein
MEFRQWQLMCAYFHCFLYLGTTHEPAYRRYSAVAGLGGFDGVLLSHERHPERQHLGQNALSKRIVGCSVVLHD